MEKASKIFVANSTEMLGSAIFRESKKSNFVNIISSTSKELYQRNQNAGIKMYKFYKKNMAIISFPECHQIYMK